MSQGEIQRAVRRAKRTVERVAHFKCPHCGELAVSEVVDTRPRYVKEGIRRRHECSWCEKRYSTLEQVIPQVDAEIA